MLTPFLLLQAGYLYERFQSRQANEFQANLEMARAVAGTLNEFVQDILHQELAICINLTMHQDLSVDQMEQILEANRAAYPAIRNFSWVTPDGLVLASSSAGTAGNNLSDRLYVRKILEGNESSVSEVLLSHGNGEPVFAVSRGIRNDEGKLLGIVVAGIKAETLGSILELQLSKKGTITILDNRGMVVDHYPKREWKWEDRNLLKTRPVIQKALNGQEVIGTFPDLNGEEQIAAYSPSRFPDWVVSVARSRDATIAPIKSQVIKQAGMSFILTTLVFLVAFFLSNTIADPIRKLRECAMALGRGKLKQRIKIAGTVELQDLASSFNTMAEEISMREEALRASEEKYRELVQNANSIILRMNLDGTVTFFNEYAQNFFGYSEEEILGRRVIGTIVPESESAENDLSTLVEFVARHPELHTDQEHENIKKNGDRIFVMWANRALLDGEGKVCGILSIGTDISDHKRAEDALRQSEQEKAAILSSLRDVAVEYLDPQLRIIWANTATARVFNTESDNLKGNLCYEAIHGLFEPCDGCTAIKAARTGELHEGEVVRPDGRTWLVSSNPIKDSSGNVTSVVHAAMNITTRKRMEEALRESEERYRGLVESQSDLVVRIDLERRHLFVNEAYCRAFGKRAGDLLGEKIDDLILPEEQPRVSAVLQEIMELPNRATIENRVSTIHGERWFNWQISGIRNSEGAVVEIQGVARDITERKRVEEALRNEILERKQVESMLRLEEARLEALWQLSQMAESSMEQIAEFSLEQLVRLTGSEIGWIGFMDEGQKDLLLHNWSATAVLDRTVARLPRRIRIENAGIWADAIRERRVVVVNDYADANPKGDMEIEPPLDRILIIPVFENERIVAIAGVGNKPNEYNASDARQLTLMMDGMWKIMQRERAEKTLRESERLSAMGRALAAVAHDMKTPLIAIGGFTRLAQKYIAPQSPVQAKLDIVIEETQRLENMVKDMLDFSRPLELNRSLGDVGRLISECLTLVAPLTSENQVRMLNDSENGVPSVSLDFMRMKQVLINLAANAIQVSPKGEEVTIRSRTSGNMLLVDVIDHGCGIPADKKREIFSPFYTTKKEGTGLGLPIVRKIIEAHRGSIEVLDNIDKGTTFRLAIPIE